MIGCEIFLLDTVVGKCGGELDNPAGRARRITAPGIARGVPGTQLGDEFSLVGHRKQNRRADTQGRQTLPRRSAGNHVCFGQPGSQRTQLVIGEIRKNDEIVIPAGDRVERGKDCFVRIVNADPRGLILWRGDADERHPSAARHDNPRRFGNTVALRIAHVG